MGFGSFMKGLGKIALKAAPIAASFIPGVGPLAAMAISAGSGVADKKLSGGSWKQALGAGAMGAGTSALGSALSGAKLGDMGKFTSKGALPLTGLQKVGKGITAGLGGLGIAQDVMANRAQGPQQQSQQGGGGIGPSGGFQMQPGYMQGYGFQPPRPQRSPFMREPMPDFGASLMAGRNVALQNQPFRAGQAPFTYVDPETQETKERPGGGLPPISPQFGQSFQPEFSRRESSYGGSRRGRR